jgi:nuclear pore complex protein Nup98-Nup96
MFGSGFGSSSNATTGTAFGSTPNPTFGGAATQNNGTVTLTQFNPHTDKDTQGGGQTNAYQSVSALPQYQNFSPEELRFVDYAQGRKHGNQSGQPGAFGASTNFGAFGGSTNTGAAFGASTNTGSTGGLFGGTGNTPSAFGAGTTGSAFGSNANSAWSKPGGTGLFGSSTTTSAPATGTAFGTTGSAFGGTGTGTGFGSGTTANTGFGAQQNKPFGGGFGASTGTGTGLGSTGFGAGSTGGGLFSGNTAASGFGANQPASSSLFGQNTQQQGQTGTTAFGGFGANQTKPGGLFTGASNTATGNSLFGQPQQQQQPGASLFSNPGNQQTGGMFGKPPNTAGLFGNPNPATNTGTGLFGGAPQQQQGGIFGGGNAQQSGGLFSKPPGQTSAGLGGSIFGQGNAQQQSTGSGLFGGSQPQQSAMGGSLFNSQQQQPQQSQQQHLLATLSDNPYGNAQLFTGLATPAQSLGPIATPISSTQKRKPAPIPYFRQSPLAASRLITPQKRQGFGFSYSTYGTPGSAFSSVNGSPAGLGASLLSASVTGRSLNKSFSTSNLRHSFSAQEAILAPGAFSSTPRSGSGGMKKLNINRAIVPRVNLFSQESSALSKKVSFEGTSPAIAGNPEVDDTPRMSSALVRREDDAPSPPTIRGSPSVTPPAPSHTNGSATTTPLPAVPENGVPPVGNAALIRINRANRRTQKDQIPGEYYTKPTLDEIRSWPRDKRANVKDFEVGREGVGRIIFHKVDLTTVPLDQIINGIVVLETRQATVYGDDCSVPKPPQGSGLNVPSTITLENSFPRAKGGKQQVIENRGPRFEKHVKRLKALENTQFINYDAQEGAWTFHVQHYTTYGLEYDDDDTTMLSTHSADSDAHRAQVSATNPSAERTPVGRHDVSMFDSPGSSVDDTFDFKKGKRKVLPGQFDDEDMADEELQDVVEYESNESTEKDDDSADEPAAGHDDFDMAGSFPAPGQNGAIDGFEPSASVAGAVKLPVGKNSVVDAVNGTPSKPDPLVLQADWAQQLQQTASPIKRDRQALRDFQSSSPEYPTKTEKSQQIGNQQGFSTTLDIMKSLFSSPAKGAVARSHEVRH